MKRAFTMIELLVVISIILVLMGLLSPVLSSARESAIRESSGARMGQLALATNAYAVDNQEALPCYRNDENWLLARDPAVTTLGIPTDSKHPKQLVASLAPYLGYNADVWYCPADKFAKKPDVHGEINHLYSSFHYLAHPANYNSDLDHTFPLVTTTTNVDQSSALFLEPWWFEGKSQVGYWRQPLRMQSFPDGHVTAFQYSR